MKLKEMRLKLGMTQQELAEALGTTVVTISRWENAGTKIAHPTILHLAMQHLRLQATEAVAELEPCPFCGIQSATLVAGMGEFWVLCINVECYGSTRMASTEAEAIAAWNRRADASTIATLRKALQTTEDRVHRMEDVIAGCETCSAALDEKGE